LNALHFGNSRRGRQERLFAKQMHQARCCKAGIFGVNISKKR
jgi:hypothetical protein